MDTLATAYGPLLAMMLLSGAAGGLMAGLLGVGGGIVVVPVLDLALSLLGVDPALRMHVAVATSMATIIPTAISSARAHHARGAVDIALLRRWGPAMFLSAIAGTLLASRAPGNLLALVFGTVALLVAAKMLLLDPDLRIADRVPEHPLAYTLPAGIGCVSSMMGIGGGTLSVPTLTLLNQPVHSAVGTSSLFGVLISIPAAIAYVATGWGEPGLPAGSVGYVNLPGFILIAPVSTLLAPLGARIAHGLSRRQLSNAFGAFLLLVGARMLWSALG
ncbi:MAG: sulfite exporter TauE/SafE family protein [Pseudomonadales bacterium]|nr:sulfite exporter TauE/SafE family protein [Pseudomonadales bacterium]MCP5182565.1 sulfite exporter TauE/SafE family protein [Pseudomonadales bacterium]